MKLKEAIRLIENRPIGVNPDSSVELNGALQLLIEAGKRIETFRERKYYYARSLLPGETEE